MTRIGRPIITLVLSLIPGLSHLYLGQIKKAIVLFIIDIGVGLALIFSQSYLMKLIMVNIYLFNFILVCLETYNYAKGKKLIIKRFNLFYALSWRICYNAW
jgi:hypothetical protein